MVMILVKSNGFACTCRTVGRPKDVPAGFSLRDAAEIHRAAKHADEQCQIVVK